MTQTPKSQPLAPRVLGDDTLVAFVSDTHIGGDVGHTIFETSGSPWARVWAWSSCEVKPLRTVCRLPTARSR